MRFVVISVFGFVIGILFLSIGITTVFGAEYPEKIADSLTEYYNMRGDAYVSHDNRYMAFLSYDKAGNQEKKDLYYNNSQLHQNIIKSLEEKIEKSDLGVYGYQELINESYLMRDFEKTIKYSDELAEIMPENWVAYSLKHRALLFMGRQSEALDVFEKYAEAEGFSAPVTSVNYVTRKMGLLYSLGEYKEALELLDEAHKMRGQSLAEIKDKALLAGSYGLPLTMANTGFVALLYEKQGNYFEAEIWYSFDDLDELYGKDCLMITRHHISGFHDEAVRLAEFNNNIDECSIEIKWNYIVSKDVVTGAYQPPFEYPPSELSSSPTMELKDEKRAMGLERETMTTEMQEKSGSSEGGGFLFFFIIIIIGGIAASVYFVRRKKQVA